MFYPIIITEVLAMFSSYIHAARPSAILAALFIVILAFSFAPSPFHSTIHFVAAMLLLNEILISFVYWAKKMSLSDFVHEEWTMIVFIVTLNVPMTVELLHHGAKHCLR
jgi:hypothetical protein